MASDSRWATISGPESLDNLDLSGRIAITAFVFGLAFLVLTACGPTQEGTSLEMLTQHADDTNVCVRNENTTAASVVMRDGHSGQRYGDVFVSSKSSACEWINLPPTRRLNAVVDGIGIAQAVVPPQFRGIFIRERGYSLRLVLGVDGLTPFAHSYIAP